MASTSRVRSVTSSISGPERFVALVLLAFGLIACLAVPLSAGYDEETHFVRAWEMAHLYFVPNEQLGSKLPFPALYWELSYRRQPMYDAIAPGFYRQYAGLRMDAHDYMYANLETRSVYSPVLLLPQALTLRYLGFSAQLPALTVYYACRIAGLLAYLLLSWLAVRLIPFGKWLLAILIVSPMALFQASTISADTISNGIGFLFLGASLAIVVMEEIRWKQWLWLLGLIALLFVAKVNLIFLVLLPFLLISPSKFSMKHGYALLAAAAFVLFVFEVGGWNILAYSKFTRALTGANPRDQLFFIASNPLLFIKIIAQDVWTNTPAYMQGWVGVYGYNYWPVPALTYLLYPLAAIASLLPHGGARPLLRTSTAGGVEAVVPDRRMRLILVSLFIIGYLLTIVSLYVAFTPVGSLLVAGVQGRYFTIVMPLLFLALIGLSLRGGHRQTWQSTDNNVIVEDPALSGARTTATKQSSGDAAANRQSGRRLPDHRSLPAHEGWVQRIAMNVPTFLPVALSLAALLLYTAGLILSYHVSCGSEYYTFGLCYQPQYKNWAPESLSSAPVSPVLTLTQEIVPACDGMTELSVWVNSNGTDPAGTTQLTLRAPTEQKDVVQQTFTNAAITKDGWLTVDFSPEWKSKDQLYLLTLKGSSAGGIRVGYSEKSEYLRGKLFENNTPVSQDMLFQYGCVAGLDKLLGMRK